VTELFSLVIVCSTAYFGVMSRNIEAIYQNPALIGLALSWSYIIASGLGMTLKWIADCENSMNALVRML